MNEPVKVRNIGPKGCKRRVMQGETLLIFSFFYLIVVWMLKAPAIWWVPVLVTTFAGILAVLQAIEKTCIFMAAQGIQMLDDSNKHMVRDNDLARALRDKSTKLVVKALLLTALFYGFYKLVPKNF